MPKTRNSFAVILASLAYSLVAAGSVSGAEPATAGGGNFVPAPESKVVCNAAPPGAHILSVPALMPKKQAWVTVVNAVGVPLAKVSVLVNGVPFDTNAAGQAVFTVPNTGAVALVLKAADETEIEHRDFALLPDGLLAVPEAGAAVQSLVPADRGGPLPALLYAPAVVEAGEMIAVLGDGFDARPGSDRILVDGVPSDVVSGSPNALLGRVPAHINAGPIKELYVATKSGDTTTPLEADVVRVTFETDVAQPKRGDEFPARVAVYGTNLPAIVRLTNNAASVLKLTSKDGRAVSNDALIVVPGAEQNFESFTATQQTRGGADISVHLLSDVPEFVGEHVEKMPRYSELQQAINYAALVKMKRRLLGVEGRLLEVRSQRVKADAPAAEQERRTAELRALAVRQNALSAMLAARRAVFQSSGGTAAQYRQALDDAAGGAYYFLEAQARPMAVVADTPVIQAGLDKSIPPRRARAWNLPEPKFILWPPALVQVSAAGSGQSAPLPGVKPEVKPDEKPNAAKPSDTKPAVPKAGEQKPVVEQKQATSGQKQQKEVAKSVAQTKKSPEEPASKKTRKHKTKQMTKTSNPTRRRHHRRHH